MTQSEDPHLLGSATRDADGKAIAQPIWLGHYPVGRIVEGRVLYIEPDHLGTPRAVIDPVRNLGMWHSKLKVSPSVRTGRTKTRVETSRHLSSTSSGWVIETGFGMPGAAHQVYEYNRRVLDTEISW